jgi:hypothetical protein
VKTPEPASSVPPAGPANVKEPAGANGATELDGAEAVLAPKVLLATTEQV